MSVCIIITIPLQFQSMVDLEGHDDWVRNLAFAVTDNGEIMLASSSQDTYVRLWKLSFPQLSENNDSLAQQALAVTDEEDPIAAAESVVQSFGTRGHVVGLIASGKT
jgi:elongator complex protein 2